MIIESLLVACLAVLLDLKLGDPKNRYHPTAWIGSLIARLVLIAKDDNPTLEKIGGICVVVSVTSLVLLPLFALDIGISLITNYYVSFIISLVAGILLLKTVIAIRGMEKHAICVLESLDGDNLDVARTNLSMIVKRDTKNLDRNHILSGVLESISENTVDGVTGPLFYYAIFGLYGAFVYRVINTADSMIGYQSNMFRNIGWFAATTDSVLNYIPSRLTGMTMVMAAAVLQHNWRESYRTMLRDGKKTQSYNAGYPMAALAGALETRFEKINHYQLGCRDTVLTKKHVYSAISIMKLSSVIFFGMITVPIITVLSLVGWWIHA